MAVYTEISRTDFEKLLSKYDIGNLVDIHGIAEGVQNSNYLIETTSGKYIGTVYEKWVDLSELPFFLSLKEYLAKKEIPCPLPIHAKDKSLIQEIKGKPFAIVSFLKGKWPKTINNIHCEEVGKMLARLHTASLGFDMKRKNPLSVNEWKKYFQGIAQDSSRYISWLGDNINEALELIKGQWPRDLPSGIIHADLFPDNVFFIENKITGVLDFYFACNDFFAYDLVITMNAWCFEKNLEFNITKAKYLLAGYNSERKITDKELDSLPVLARGAALRFLLTRLYDWLHRVEGAVVSIKDPMEYIRKLDFHMQVKSHTEYGF